MSLQDEEDRMQRATDDLVTVMNKYVSNIKEPSERFDFSMTLVMNFFIGVMNQCVKDEGKREFLELFCKEAVNFENKPRRKHENT